MEKSRETEKWLRWRTWWGAERALNTLEQPWWDAVWRERIPETSKTRERESLRVSLLFHRSFLLVVKQESSTCSFQSSRKRNTKGEDGERKIEFNGGKKRKKEQQEEVLYNISNKANKDEWRTTRNEMMMMVVVEVEKMSSTSEKGFRRRSLPPYLPKRKITVSVKWITGRCSAFEKASWGVGHNLMDG